METLGYLTIAGGLLFFFVSGVGLIRMPDLYTRMHAGAKSTTLGSLLILIGAAFIEPQWAPKLIVLAVFTLVTNPLSSSVLARAAHHVGTDSAPMEQDAYAEHREGAATGQSGS